jgi:hypothetical protein
VVDEVLAFYQERGGSALHVSASVAPRFQEYSAQLRRSVPLTIHPQQPLVDWRSTAPRRFSAFWRKVEADALRPTGEGPPELAN